MPHVEEFDDGSGYGVYDWSNRRGYGVVGESLNNIAVYGTSYNHAGVLGSSSASDGMYGRSISGVGVAG